MWCLLLYLQTNRPWLPAITGLVLGVGLYSYITSWVVMPFYLALTLIAYWRADKPARAGVALVAAFAVPLLPLIAWLSIHPEMPRDVFSNYKVVTSYRVAERVALYWDYFNPSYLFFSGGSNLQWATRRAGVFLLPFMALLPVGAWATWTRASSTARTVVLAGFFFAPMPIVMALPEAPQYSTARDLLVVPFGVLLAVGGVSG